jgi:crotonobetaine/carnitine-CoA ligase
MDAAATEPDVRHMTIGAVLGRQAAAHGEHPFLRFEGADVSYAEADRLTDRLAAGFAAIGVGHGTHVAIILANRPEFLWTYFALGKLGAVSVPINTAAKGDLLAYYLEHSDATVLVVEAALTRRLAELPRPPASIAKVVVVGDAGFEAGSASLSDRVAVHDFAALAADPGPLPAVTVRFNDVFLFQYTSGTTGPSKANVTPHCSALYVAYDFKRAFGYGPGDVLFTCLPLFHGNAFLCATLPALVSGATLALSRRFSASSFWQEIRDSGATQFNALGAMSNILFGRPAADTDRAHRVRQCMTVPVPDFGRAFEERFGLRLTSVFAMTDYGTITLRTADDPPGKFQSAGRARPEVSIAIMDDDDIPLPPRSTGEICLRSNRPWSASLGYYKMAEGTLAAIRNLWFHTGDRGYLDEDGYLYFVDRKKDAIRRRGENISSFEVEQAVGRHPDVAEVAAFPVRAEMLEDEVMVSVVLRQGAALTERALVAFCAEAMAYYMVPRFVEFVAELPKTMTEKVEKYKLRASAEARITQVWDREREGVVVKRDF